MENDIKRKPVHIFDVDLTVIKKTSALHFIKFALKEKIIKFQQISGLIIEWINYKLARPDINFIEKTVKKLEGLEKSELERIADICFEKKLKPNIYKDAARLIQNALKNNEKVIFATSSFDFIIKPLERHFGIESSLACRLEYSGGKTTGNLDGFSFFAGGKKNAARAWMESNNILPQDVYFYSDSYTDIPLLEYCGNPAAVNPDRILARYAKKHGWKIMRFKNVMGN